MAVPVSAAQQQQQQQQQHSELVAARNEVLRLRAELDKKDALCSTRILENNREQARKFQFSKTQWTETESSLKQRVDELASELTKTVQALKDCESEVEKTRLESENRFEQLCNALETQHKLQATLSLLLESIGQNRNPYSDNPENNSGAVYTEVNDDELSRLEVGVLLRAKQDVEVRCKYQESKLAQLTREFKQLQSESLEKDKVIEQNSTTIENYKINSQKMIEKLKALSDSYEKEKKMSSSMESEVRRLQAVLDIAGGARKELQHMYDRKQEALAAAIRRRVNESVETSLMQQEDCASQEFQIVHFMKQCYEEDKFKLKLELEEASRTVMALNNINTTLRLEVDHVKKELKRAADLVQKFSPKGFVQTFVTEGSI
jgi:hypothetical protein